MKTISKGRLKARMLACFREVEATGEPLIVTDRGREVLEVRPVGPKRDAARRVLADYRSGSKRPAKIPDEADLLAPEAEGDWAALSGDEAEP